VLFGSDSIEFAAGLGRDVSKDIPTACRCAVETAKAKSTLPSAICITLPESLTTSGQQIVETLRQHLDRNVPVIGGLQRAMAFASKALVSFADAKCVRIRFRF
jgi:hypothetical protein